MARCPYCGSTNARSINNVQQVLAEIAGASGALLGGLLRLPGKVTYRNVRDALCGQIVYKCQNSQCKRIFSEPR